MNFNQWYIFLFVQCPFAIFLVTSWFHAHKLLVFIGKKLNHTVRNVCNFSIQGYIKFPVFTKFTTLGNFSILRYTKFLLRSYMYTKFFKFTLSFFYVYEFRSFCILKFIYVYMKFICASAFRVTRIVQHADSHADVFVVNYVVESTFDAAQKFGLFGSALFSSKGRFNLFTRLQM